MSSCGCQIEAATAEQRRILTLALVLNAAMFIVGLIADSLDMLADASAYTIGLVAIGRSGSSKLLVAGIAAESTGLEQLD